MVVRQSTDDRVQRMNGERNEKTEALKPDTVVSP